MNCKQGDLAVIVRSKAGNEGRIVRCVRFVGFGDDGLFGDCWLMDRPLQSSSTRLNYTVSDSKLRPIRDNDGEDETLQWAGKPEQVTA